MKLVLKQPEDKPPFIGIQYESEYLAARTNADIVKTHNKECYELILEPIDQHYINLRLVNKDKMIDRSYNQIEYNAPKLKNWLFQNENKKEFNFSHVIMNFDKHVVVKIHIHKPFLIKLDSVKLVSEDS
jgi:hypothetical protein